jgi:uncharacterized protein YbjT (DUF2867 family)
LLTGATGFVGRRLLAALAEAGFRVRAVSRTAHPSTEHVEWVQADVMDALSLSRALEDVRAAYYLVHSMGGTAWKLDYTFAERDRAAAERFARAAAGAGLEQIIYLGGLGDMQAQLSRHLASRNQVGEILQSGAVPTTVLRAGIILGAGSASFEMLRYLVARLPVMITPRWVNTRTQPIAIRDVVAYLVGVLQEPRTHGQTLDIGGEEILTYREMMERFAAVMGRRLFIIGVPVLTPHLSSYWVNLMTPTPAGIAMSLIEGLRNEAICQNDNIRKWIPIPLTPYDEAVKLALAEETEPVRFAFNLLPAASGA